MVLKQIKCPPKGNDKYSIPIFVNKWLPAMETYALDYVGIGDIIGTTSNKKADKVAIGYNKFVPIGGKCGSKSDSGCSGQERHMYLKTYPLGYIPNCEDDNGNYNTTGTEKIIGGTSLIGGMQEDLYNLNVKDTMAAMFNKGPFASDDCMKVRLPVGNGLLKGGEKSVTDAQDTGSGWYVEEKCVPRQPTIQKNYGGQSFNIPYSASWCRKPTVEQFQVRQNKVIDWKYLLLMLFVILLLVASSYKILNKKTASLFVLVFILFLFLMMVLKRTQEFSI